LKRTDPEANLARRRDAAYLAPSCVPHPDEAKARDLTQGQKIRLFNERGTIGLVLRVGDDLQPGMVLVPGQRPDDGAAAAE
jgi:anaerobic selenocysteine-containing dehydrogenase